MLQIQSKRFYLDVKQNKRGKFIKVEKRLSLLASSARNRQRFCSRSKLDSQVAEISADGRRAQIFMALSTAG